MTSVTSNLRPCVAVRMEARKEYFRLRKAGFNPKLALERDKADKEKSLKEFGEGLVKVFTQRQEALSKAREGLAKEIPTAAVLKAAEDQLDVLTITHKQFEKFQHDLEANLRASQANLSVKRENVSQLRQQLADLKNLANQTQNNFPCSKELNQVGSNICNYIARNK